MHVGNMAWGLAIYHKWKSKHDVMAWNNHKRVHRVYGSIELNLPRRTRKRIPGREYQSSKVASRVNNLDHRCGHYISPEFISQTLVLWTRENGRTLHHIQPGKPIQNASDKRLNKTFRIEVRDAYMFYALDEVRDHAWEWMIDYNEAHLHDALGNIPSTIYHKRMGRNSTLEPSAWQGSLLCCVTEKRPPP